MSAGTSTGHQRWRCRLGHVRVSPTSWRSWSGGGAGCRRAGEVPAVRQGPGGGGERRRGRGVGARTPKQRGVSCKGVAAIMGTPYSAPQRHRDALQCTPKEHGTRRAGERYWTRLKSLGAKSRGGRAGGFRSPGQWRGGGRHRPFSALVELSVECVTWREELGTAPCPSTSPLRPGNTRVGEACPSRRSWGKGREVARIPKTSTDLETGLLLGRARLVSAPV